MFSIDIAADRIFVEWRHDENIVEFHCYDTVRVRRINHSLYVDYHNIKYNLEHFVIVGILK